MNNQNPNSNPTPQFSTTPVPTAQPQLSQTPITAAPEIPTLAVPPTQPEIPSAPEPFYKNKIFMIGGGILAVILILFGGYYAYAEYRAYNSPIPNLYPNWTPYPMGTFITPPPFNYSPAPEPSNIPLPTTATCNSQLAPSNVPDFDKCNYRDSKISITDAQAVMSRVGKQFGAIQVPSSITWAHQETYRGIPIKWTAGQPLSNNTLSWIKTAIDILPPYFYQQYPAQAIISATPAELNNQIGAGKAQDAAMFTSGLNIFITGTTTAGQSTDLFQVNESNTIQAFFHEWVHVIQNYDTVQTFTEDYLSQPLMGEQALRTDPLLKSYAKAAGWVFQNDQYGNSSYAILGTDADPQKQTDYGKSEYIEDMAEAGSYFMLCQDDKISEARIKWWEQTTGTNRNTYCPAKF